jgi:hypothetical protein
MTFDGPFSFSMSREGTERAGLADDPSGDRGSDTWIDQRWTQYDDLMRGYRTWLAQLPADQARNVAHANAERLFGGKVGE